MRFTAIGAGFTTLASLLSAMDQQGAQAGFGYTVAAVAACVALGSVFVIVRESRRQ